MEFITYVSAEGQEFLRLFELYRSIFGNDDEAEDFEGIQRSYRMVVTPELSERFGPFQQYWIEARQDGVSVGGVNFTVFKIDAYDLSSVHINYIFVSPAQRGKGIGRVLLEKVKEVSCADLFFCEQNSPDRMSSEEIERDLRLSGISATQRIRWWLRRGFRALDMDYIQPPLSEEKSPCTSMTLNVYPWYVRSLSAGLVREHLLRFYYLSVFKAGCDLSEVEPYLAPLDGRDWIPTVPCLLTD